MSRNPAILAHAACTAVVVSAIAFAQSSGGEHNATEHADDHSAQTYTPADGITGPDLLGMGPDITPEQMNEAMAEWSRLMQPSTGHKVLERFVGDFDAEMTVFMRGPGGAVKSSAVCSNRLILGGRYLQSDFKGEFMGQPFEGMQLIGYDNLRNQFVTVWIDSMSTAPTVANGQLSEDGTTITMIGEMDEPMTGEIGKPVKWITRFTADDRFVFSAVETIYGEEFTVFRIVNERRE